MTVPTAVRQSRRHLSAEKVNYLANIGRCVYFFVSWKFNFFLCFSSELSVTTDDTLAKTDIKIISYADS